MPGEVVILGPGLLGGSLALALADQGHAPIVWGRREAPLQVLAKRHANVRTESCLETAVRAGDMIVLATPIGVMPSLLRTIVEVSAKDQHPRLITDVGSVKAPIVTAAAEILEGSSCTFVGSHPMAGSEASGVDAARPDLFHHARCLLTPTADTPEAALEAIQKFWEALECRIHELDPQTHDRVVAHVSHMPHAAASLVVAAALRQHPGWAEHSGAGLHDTTRVASGEPPMWAEILLENQAAVLEALKSAQSELQHLIQLVESGENAPLQRFLLEAKELRDTHIVPRRPL